MHLHSKLVFAACFLFVALAVNAQSLNWQLPDSRIRLVQDDSVMAVVQPSFPDDFARVTIDGKEYELTFKNDWGRCIVRPAGSEKELAVLRGLGRRENSLSFSDGRQVLISTTREKKKRIVQVGKGSTLIFDRGEVSLKANTLPRSEELLAQSILMVKYLYERRKDEVEEGSVFIPIIIPQ